MNSFYKMIRNLIAEETNSSHFSFKIVDPTAVGENPVRELSLDVVPVAETSSIVTLAWKDSAEKILEKTTSTQEANHLAELISTDLAQVVKLTSEDNYAEAKKVMENVLKTYLETTDTPISTNLPKLHNTQASIEKVADAEIAFERAVDHLDNKLMKGLIHQEEYDAEYAKLKKEMFPKEASLDDKLWKISKITMQNLWFSNTDELLEYQEKQKGAKSTQDHIPLWDAEHGKDPAKEKDTLSPASLSYEDVQNEKERDHEDMTKHIDETIKNKLESAMQEKAASVFGPDQIELVKVLRKNGRNWDEVKRILVKDFNFDKDATTIFVDEQRQSLDPTGIDVEPVKEEPESLRPPKELVPDSVHEKLLQDHEDKKKVDPPIEDKELNFTPKDVMNIPEDEEIEKVESLSNEIARADNDEIHKQAAPSDLNPLQEPIQEAPTTPSVPSQDRIPFGQSSNHRAPKPDSWVIVKTDLKGELPSFRGKFISEKTESDGSKWGIVDRDGELLQVEMNRITPESEGAGAQDTEPVMEPIIEQQQPENDVQITPKMDDFHTSSQEDLLAIKIEAEALLKDIDGMEKISYKFIKKGLEKHADDSAFEGNGWCRVWVQEDEVATSSKYAEILKLPDENARIAALKEVARELAHESLRLADSAGAKVGVQSWFDSLKPSDHDRIDWVKLATPQVAESSLKEAADGSACIKCDKVHKLEDMIKNEHGAGYLCKADAPAWNKDASLKQSKLAKDTPCLNCPHLGDDHGNAGVCIAKDCKCKGFACEEGNASMGIKSSDFEKGISQNKTSADPVEEAPKTQFKDYKITPKYTPKEQAIPATPEMDEVLTKMDSLQSNLATLEAARKQIQAKMKEELTKIDEQGERAQLEAALQESIEKAAVLISAMDNKVIQWKDRLYTLQTEEISYVPSLTPKEMLSKIYAKFSGAEKYVQDVLNGMLSQGKNVLEKTLIRWPNKKSSVNKEATIIDDINHYNEELLAALKELSSPL